MSLPPASAIVPAMGAAPIAPHAPATQTAPIGQSFSQLLANGVDAVNQRVVEADSLAAAFAVNDSIPLHRVTYALEQARLSLELMLQVRSRLVEAYQEVSRMQL
ncbi:MAG: flagellar hook-basal body complex protein FliE [Parcubacteria group bacterium]